MVLSQRFINTHKSVGLVNNDSNPKLKLYLAASLLHERTAERILNSASNRTIFSIGL
jgi:hypothetical protein